MYIEIKDESVFNTAIVFMTAHSLVIVILKKQSHDDLVCAYQSFQFFLHSDVQTEQTDISRHLCENELFLISTVNEHVQMHLL